MRLRRKATIGALALVLLLGLAGDVVPYEGDPGQRCPPALPAYGLRTDALLAPEAEDADPCESTGQLLVLFGWMSLLGVAVIGGIWWWAGDS